MSVIGAERSFYAASVGPCGDKLMKIGALMMVV